MLRYIAQHQDEYNLKEIYQRFFINRYKRFSSFKQALKRNKDSFVNPMCMIKEKITNKFSSFEIQELILVEQERVCEYVW